jgi:hypothetical protein
MNVEDGMLNYIAFYKGKKIVVQASTSYNAQCIAAKQLKAKKYYEVTVMRADVEHSTAAI